MSNYVEVFLDVPINELERRDPKGLYLKYKQGLIKNMVGLDLKAEFPKKQDFHFKWDNEQKLNHTCDKLSCDFLARIKN